jgi:hypothetical protein
MEGTKEKSPKRKRCSRSIHAPRQDEDESYKMTRHKKNSANAHTQELREALTFFEAEYKRNGRHRFQNFNLRARRGVVLMGELLKTLDLNRLKVKISFFLRQNTPVARYRSFTIGAFYKWVMRGGVKL